MANLEFNNALPSGDMIEMDDLPAACAFEKSRVIRAAIDSNDVALYCSKTSASDAAITAGLSCKRNSGEELDISQLIEEKTPTRSGETVDINNVVGDSMLPQLTAERDLPSLV